MSDHLHIRGLRVECTVGIYDDERTRTQPLSLDIRLDADLHRAGRSGRIAHTCDYAQVAVEVSALLQFRRYKLLEMAAEEICAMILGVHPVVDGIRLRIDKPEALVGAGAMASVSLQRRRADYAKRHEFPRWGQVDVLLETRDAGLYLLHVGAGQRIPAHHHEKMRELEWLIQGELSESGRQLQLGQPVTWELGQVHSYANAGTGRATLFCCDTPPFMPDDEIVTGTDRA